MSTAVASSIEWMSRGACRGVTRDIFFPDSDQLVSSTAKRLCGRCDVRDECLQYALDQRIEFGIWGGLTEEQRRSIDRRRHRVRCPDCRSDNVIEEGRSEVCLSCGLSWAI